MGPSPHVGLANPEQSLKLRRAHLPLFSRSICSPLSSVFYTRGVGHCSPTTWPTIINRLMDYTLPMTKISCERCFYKKQKNKRWFELVKLRTQTPLSHILYCEDIKEISLSASACMKHFRNIQLKLFRWSQHWGHMLQICDVHHCFPLSTDSL